ncbi:MULTISPECIES: GNAT family N-acetyltransferase [Streptomyces]|jgi:predicted acetyltransferase|uniref:GNAT family N-acetyltransferase n=1 Tax=unclassified Streptomyces TaxID=2593676 RepID=UPI00089073A6|nr:MULTISPECIES: GNAT family N-acetyltransferase [unclassified Streptomyces]MDX2728091.1 GNAT family N-acetyltransferase [Streptomyces sp. PA03-2a]SCY84119.1 Predicted acetyltransferase [Streptomyces sp. 136MFCol5.1]SFT11909.1 Predicted acetyltransferase [Streptomyces sp. ok210]
MTTQLRVLRPSEWNEWFGSLELAFGGVVADSPEERELWEALTEHERSIGIWDGPDVVGTAGAFSFRLAVPGGALVPAAGVTMVSVASTHRRRGLLTSMMRRQLDDVRALGEPLAVLTASEPAIYGRFGYGSATRQMSLEIDTDRVRLTVPDGTDEVRLRYARPDEATTACEGVYERLVAGRPGTPAHGPGWERRALIDPASARRGASPLQCLLAERAGEVVGYSTFRIKPDWDTAGPKGRIAVDDLSALDPAAYAALWRFLFEIDLTSTVEARNRPVDDAVLHLVSDVRRCNIKLRDSLYVRLVELGAALEARAYRASVDVVFEVEDAFCPWNAGRWRLTADTKGGASCKRTDDPADLALSVRELGTVYLGGESLVSLARAGRVQELRAGAVAEAASAFSGMVEPWLPRGF